MLKQVGLTSITVGIETPNETTLKHYKRAPINDDKQRIFVETCRQLGIRTVAGFMIGFPEDTAQSIKGVLRYARNVNPTFANFNVVTPYPGTEFFTQVQDQIADFDYTKYNVYTPVMKYQHLTADEVRDWHARCFTKFYFRWDWLKAHAHLLWPVTRWLGMGPGRTATPVPSVDIVPIGPAVDSAVSPLPILPQIVTSVAGDNCHTGGNERRVA